MQACLTIESWYKVAAKILLWVRYNLSPVFGIELVNAGNEDFMIHTLTELLRCFKLF